MTLGYALIVVFVLYLIDKHDRWRQTAKIVTALIVLGIVGIVGFYGWTKYGDYRTAKREAAQEAAFQRNVRDCIARNAGAGPRNIFDTVSMQEACEKDSETQPPCWSKPNDKGFQIDLNNMQDLNGKRIPPTTKQLCFPIVNQTKAPDCKDGLVVGCIDRSSEPWEKYGATQQQRVASFAECW